MIEIIKGLLIIVGTGVILHYYAYAIAWGIRKGQGKRPKNDVVTLNLNKI